MNASRLCRRSRDRCVAHTFLSLTPKRAARRSPANTPTSMMSMRSRSCSHSKRRTTTASSCSGSTRRTRLSRAEGQQLRRREGGARQQHGAVYRRACARKPACRSSPALAARARSSSARASRRAIPARRPRAIGQLRRGAAKVGVSGEIVDGGTGKVLARFTQERRSGFGLFGGGYRELLDRTLKQIGGDVAGLIRAM